MLGVGGGIVFVPTLALVLGLDQVDAEATSLLAILGVGVVGAWRQYGYGNVREVDDLAKRLEFDDDELDALHERIDARGIDLTDDCGRSDATQRVEYKPEDLATSTTDALQLFLNEIRKYPLLTAAEEIELAKRIEKGDMAAKERMINSNLRLVVSIAKKYQGQPTDEEISKESGVPLEQIEEIRDAGRAVTSLDKPIGEEGETALGDLFPSDEPSPEEEVHLTLSEEVIRRTVDELPEPERDVLKLRYGINGDEPTPLRETGKRLGMSPERVRQIESKALAKLAMRRELDALRVG